MSSLIPLAAASDMSRSRAFSEQRLVNFYAEASSLGGKSPFVLLGTPGLKPFTTAGSVGFRGGITMAATPYFVSGKSLYRVDNLGGVATLGSAIINGSGFVSMATIGTQIAIATSAENGFIYDNLNGILKPISDPNFFGGTSVTALDDMFVWGCPAAFTNRFQISAINDGLTYDALDFASAESTASPLTRVFLAGTQLFMMKPDRIEIWYNSGNPDFPFERLNSAIIPKGVASKFSPALVDNTVFWVGFDDDGGGSPTVFKANGYTAQIVSTPAVARALAMVSDLSQIMGISYVKDNHAFYGIILPSGNAWFYDAQVGVWHERTTYGFDRWLGSVHVDAYGKSLIGSFTDGAIYELDLDTYTDAGSLPIISEATLPTFGTDPELKRCSRLRLDMETGVGLSTGQGSDPIITLNISDDRGQTWSSDLQASMGPMGKYGRGVEWRGLGQFRSRVHKFKISDPVKRALLALYADIS